MARGQSNRVGAQEARKTRQESGIDGRISRERGEMDQSLASEAARLDGRIDLHATIVLLNSRIRLLSANNKLPGNGPIAYPDAYTLMYGNATSGWPVTGSVETINRGGSAATFQRQTAQNGTAIYLRVGINDTTWSAWSRIDPFTYLPLSGGTMSGTINMDNNNVGNLPAPTANGQAARKLYVDDADALKLSLSGGTMSGTINMNNNNVGNLPAPTANGQAARKLYVDDADALQLSRSGGIMSGTLDMNNNVLGNLTAPTAGGHAARKLYVDDADALKLPLAGGVMSGSVNMNGNSLSNLAEPVGSAQAATKGYVDTRVTAGALITPTLVNGWSSLVGYRNLSYYLDLTGNVIFRGLISGGTTTSGTVIFTLQTAYRPSELVQVGLVASNGAARVRIETNGQVIIVEGSASLGFDGVSFNK